MRWMVALSFIVDGDTSVWALVPFMVLLGLGLGFNFQPNQRPQPNAKG